MTSETVVVWLPGSLLRLFPAAEASIALQAVTVDEMMDGLDARFPGMRARLCDERPAIRRHISVFLNGDRVGLDTPLPPGSELFVITAISGG